MDERLWIAMMRAIGMRSTRRELIRTPDPLAVAVAVATLLALAGPATAATPAREQQLPVVSFNVLGRSARRRGIRRSSTRRCSTRPYRRGRITAFLAGSAATTDLFCLQEVQESELPAFLAALGPGFEGFMARNDRDWWSNWVDPGSAGRRTERP